MQKVVTKEKVRKIKVSRAKAATKPASVWFYVMTPAGMKLLRAYFLACIHAQNAFREGAPFIVWGGANLSSHVASGKLTRSNGVYALTGPGLRYFSDPAQQPEKGLLERMIAAVRTGKGAKDYANSKGVAYEMVERKLA